MAFHSKLSASQTKWWSNCPGAAAFCEVFAKPDVPGFHARMGTCVHALIEHCLEQGHDPADYEGRLVEIINEGEPGEGTSILKAGAKLPKDLNSRIIFEMDDELVEAAGKAVDYIRMRCFELGLTPDDGTGLATHAAVARLVKDGSVRLETRVNPLPDRDDTGGSGDVIIDAWPTVLEVFDYKNGSGVFVPVESNPQLRTYALGSLRFIEQEGADPYDYEAVRYTVCQPRHRDAPFDGIMKEETTPAELIAWGDEVLRPAAERVDSARKKMESLDGLPPQAAIEELHGEGYLTVGEDGSHCKWCPLAGKCPAQIAKVQEVTKAEWDDEPVDLGVPTEEDVILQAFRWAPFLDGFVKQVKANAHKHLLAGATIEGLKLRRKGTNRKFIEGLTAKDIAAFASEEGVDDEDIWQTTEPTTKSGPQLEKLVKKAGGEDARARFAERTMYKPDGELETVLATEKGEAVTVSSADEWEDEEIDE